MRKHLGIGLCLGLVLLASQAYGIDTVRAIRLSPTALQIVITGTVAGSTILWEGVGLSPPLAASTTYTGISEIVPANCRGTVTDGIMVIPNVEVEFCTTEMAGVPVTGQTTEYSPGDDGDYQAGIPWPLPRFTDNGDGTVLDNLTGLIWLQEFKCPLGVGNSVPWQEALDYIDELNTSGTMNGTDCMDTSNGGSFQTDWRLPNVKEFLSLVDWGASNPPLPPNPFLNVVPQNYWTSTTDNSAAGRAWAIKLTTGEPRSYNKVAVVARLAAVRGGMVNN